MCGAVKCLSGQGWTCEPVPEEIRKSFDVLVVGAGPAGLAAAAAAAECGARAAIIDDNPSPGGQIWRGRFLERDSEISDWASKLREGHVEVLCGACITHGDVEKRTLFAESQDTLLILKFSRLILATGARERFLPFPGWTLPNVMGAGGLQAMVKSGLPIRSKRVVVAGTGPLLLAVASHLRECGAEIRMICEQTSWPALAGFALSLWPQPAKIREAFALKRKLAGIPLAPNSWPLRAVGTEALESVVLSRNGKVNEMACDYLACGFHLVPNTELAALLGCRMRNGYVEVDESQQSSIPDVFCAGELTGIGGLELSLIGGQIAGLCAAGRGDRTGPLSKRLQAQQSFARKLASTFELRPELKSLPDDNTIVCRCEDVIHARLTQQTSWQSAKLHTRCGMGPCQGRVCGPATQFLYGWTPDSVRPPIFPSRFQSLAASECNSSEPQNR